MSESGDKHQCPWPGCDWLAGPFYWGCEAHWTKLPWSLRLPFIKAKKDADTHAVAEAVRSISEWIEQHMWERPAGYPALPTETAAAADLIGCGFAAGMTDGGEVFMLWRDGTFMTINKDEAKLVLRAIRAMLS